MVARPPIQNESEILANLIAPGSLIVDVGSTQGAFFSSFLGAGCSIISIEPNLRNVLFQHSRFSSEVETGRLTIYHQGCSDVHEERTLHINDDFEGRLSSFDELWKANFPEAFANGLEEIHHLVPRRELLHPHLIHARVPFGLLKVETDGFDLKILRGYFTNRGALPIPKAVLFGICAHHDLANNAQYCVDLLAQLRFDRFRLFVHRGVATLADSAWLTHPQLARYNFTRINDSFPFDGAGFRRATVLATSSIHLAERQLFRGQLQREVAEHA